MVFVIGADGKGHWGCPKCIWTFTRRKRDGNVRTGRKIWPAYEVYGTQKTIEKNHEWIEGVTHRAARNRMENAVISEGAFKVLEEHSRRGMIRPRVDGRPAR
jgi:hypothetical protein